MHPVFSFGYGGRSSTDVAELLTAAEIDAVCDVRSTPYSKRYASFDRESVGPFLRTVGIRYLFFGTQLGARPENAGLYVDGKASYAAMATSPPFLAGIDRLVAGAERFRIALMCAEKDPLDCHRAILIAPALTARGIQVVHLDGKGCCESHDRLEERLVRRYRLDQAELFAAERSSGSRREAYRRRESEIAYDITRAYDKKAGVI